MKAHRGRVEQGTMLTEGDEDRLRGRKALAKHCAGW